jgi:hypothetical protein
MTVDPQARCAALSLEREEAMIGTASRVVRWVLVEQPGPWGRDAVVESRLDETTAHVLRSAGRRHGFRPLVIRRPGWRDASGPRRVYLARTRAEGGWVEQLDLDDPRGLASIDWRVLDAATAPGVGSPGPVAIHLVCTNGRHDPCCADLGRPVVRALAAAGTSEVWESSHVGGDRFAANVVSLPSGVYYGRVAPDEAARLLDELERGLLRLDRYRGRSCYGPQVQVAEYHARRHLGERDLYGLMVEPGRPEGDRLPVTVRHAEGALRVVVSRHRGPAVPLSCGAGPTPPWHYRLESIGPG